MRTITLPYREVSHRGGENRQHGGRQQSVQERAGDIHCHSAQDVCTLEQGSARQVEWGTLHWYLGNGRRTVTQLPGESRGFSSFQNFVASYTETVGNAKTCSHR